MAFKGLLVVGVILAVSSTLYHYYNILSPIDLPDLGNPYWGPGESKKDDTSIRPFNIQLGQKILDDVQFRLNLSRPFTPALENTQTQYGISDQLLTEMLQFLKTEYNFKEQETFLNTFPQFTTEVQGLNIHFVHIKPKVKKDVKVLPILLLHGWPSSVREFYGLVEKFTNPKDERNFVLEMVIPSIPGFGYSDGPSKRDCHSSHMAVVMKNLMLRLNHEKFYVHGSDWGAVIGTDLVTLFPNNVLGYHSNFCVPLTYKSILKIVLGFVFPSLVFPARYQHNWYPMTKSLRFFFAETGYMHLMGTKPDTIGVGLDNSLEGLVAFIMEKMSVGTNKAYIYKENAGLLDKYNYTILFDNIMFYYWIPRKATTASRIYAENLNVKSVAQGIGNIPIKETVPCGCTFFEDEFLYYPEWILKDKFVNLLHYTTYDKGGHFTAMEETELLAEDIVKFVKKTLS